jgi:hypothetical protein
VAAQSFFDSIASVLNWPGIAGETVAAHTRPDQIKFKKLYLVAESSVWIQHLTFLKPELIEKVNAAAGKPLITDVVLRVGSVPKKEDARGSGFEAEPEIPNHELQTSNLEPSVSLREEAAAHAASVTDPELRARLTDVIAQALSRQETPSKR